ncbi:hypothetical protein J22TS1_01690 [Siminovitchia terrae]|nr:hypothetical protein J22TS1_01690 [Siminovitchia terrae]
MGFSYNSKQNICSFLKGVVPIYYSYLKDFIKKLYQTLGINSPSELDMKPIANSLNIELLFWDEPSKAVRDEGIA